MTRSGVSGSALRGVCDKKRFETKPHVLAGAPRVETADNLGRKMKENSSHTSSGALVCRQTAKSADFGTRQEKKVRFHSVMLLLHSVLLLGLSKMNHYALAYEWLFGESRF